MYTPVNPQFYYIKVGCDGGMGKLHGHVILMEVNGGYTILMIRQDKIYHYMNVSVLKNVHKKDNIIGAFLP